MAGVEMRPVEGFENHYITADGRVWNDRCKRFVIPLITEFGYCRVRLWNTKEKKNYNKLVHRLVAEAFIPNPDNLPQINHIDENKKNNCVANLEWCTGKQNVHHGSWMEKNRKKLLMMADKRKRAVIQYDKEGNMIAEHESAVAGALAVGKKKSNVSYCCNGKLQTAHGYVWRWKDEVRA